MAGPDLLPGQGTRRMRDVISLGHAGLAFILYAQDRKNIKWRYGENLGLRMVELWIFCSKHSGVRGISSIHLVNGVAEQDTT